MAAPLRTRNVMFGNIFNGIPFYLSMPWLHITTLGLSEGQVPSLSGSSSLKPDKTTSPGSGIKTPLDPHPPPSPPPPPPHSSPLSSPGSSRKSSLRSSRSSSHGSRLSGSSGDNVRASRITKRWSKPRRITRSKGLQNNPGTACYRNSVYQCLFHMPEFVGYLDNLHSTQKCAPVDQKTCIVCCLKALLDTYSDSTSTDVANKRLVNLEKLIRKVIDDDHSLAQDIKADRQADSYEFLCYILEVLKKSEVSSDEVKIDDLFQMKHKSEWTCNECNRVSTSEDNSGCGVGLSLDIQDPMRGLLMLNYMRHSEYQKKLQLRCDSKRCIKKHGKDSEGFERKKTKYITKLPEILVIRLQRFAQKWNKEKNEPEFFKLQDDVSFEEYVNLGEFTEDDGRPILYQLQGVVAHSGKTLDSGHYIAVVREPIGRRFHSINDDSSIDCERGGDMSEMQFPLSLGATFDPFLLFYTKV